MLSDLTNEQKQVMEEVKKTWLDRIFSGKTRIQKDVATEGINWLYSKQNYKNPRIFFADSPLECQAIYNALYAKNISHTEKFGKMGVPENLVEFSGSLKEAHVAKHLAILASEVEGPKNDTSLFKEVMLDIMTNFRKESFCSYGNVSDYGWVSYYDFFNKIGKFDNEDFFKFRDLMASGLYDMIQLEDYCIVSEMPTLIKRNEKNDLHSTTSPAIAFADGSKLYFINNRNVPSWIIESPELITKDLYLRENNTDYRGAMYEVLGQEKMMELLGAREVSRATNKCKKPTNSNLQVDKAGNIVSGGVQYVDSEEEYILYESSSPDPELGILKWVKVNCPSTGTNYLLGVPPETTNPLDAVALTFGFEGKEYNLEQTS